MLLLPTLNHLPFTVAPSFGVLRPSPLLTICLKMPSSLLGEMSSPEKEKKILFCL